MRVYYGWFVVLASFVILLVAQGIFASFGVYFKWILDDFLWNRATISLAMSIYIIGSGISSLLIGRIVDIHGTKFIIPLCAISTSLVMVGLGFMSNLLDFYSLYGLLALASGGLSIGLMPAIVSKWFPRKRGLVIGVSTSGFAAGILVMAPVSTLIIFSYGWRMAYVISGLLIMLIVLPLSLGFLRSRYEDSSHGETKTSDFSKEGVKGITSLVRNRSFLLLSLGYFVCGFTVYMNGTHLAIFAIDLGIDRLIAANALGVSTGASIIGLIIIGALSDRIGRKNLLATTFFVRGLILIYLLGVSGVPSLFVFAIVFGITNLATVPLVAGLTGDIFGRASVGTAFGMINLIHQIGGAFGSYIGGAVFDITGGYLLAFASGAILCFGAVFFSFFVKESKIATFSKKLIST
jgi:MFS family permease